LQGKNIGVRVLGYIIHVI